jgi:dienelactone hydrolase
MARGLIAAALLAGLALLARAAPVEVPSLDTRFGGTAVALPSHWFPAATAGPAPAMVLLHGCGGLFDGRGRLGERYVEMAQQLNALGIHALVPDSLTPRGEKELCTQRAGARRVTMVERRRDALGALQWLAAQPGVDAMRLGLLGWSNGGSTVLAATDLNQAELRKARVKPVLAVAFYPGCEMVQQQGYKPVGPLLMLLGEDDDWTPAAACKGVAAQAGEWVQWQSYPGRGPVRHRPEVPGGAHPGQGVHVGGQPEARAAAALRLQAFLRAQFALTAHTP